MPCYGSTRGDIAFPFLERAAMFYRLLRSDGAQPDFALRDFQPLPLSVKAEICRFFRLADLKFV
ncbi:MAG: hypothetical protein ACLSU0_04030 [Oscillospiraceae bacterium]